MLANRVKETTTTTGTGNLTLAGAATNFQTFNNAFGLDARFTYWIVDSTNDIWETGTGYLSGTTTLVREAVTDNSSGTTSALSLSAGTKDVFISIDQTALYPLGNVYPDFSYTQSDIILTDGAVGYTTHSKRTDRLYLIPFRNITSMKIDKWAIYVKAASAGAVVRCGIYLIDPDNGQPQLDPWMESDDMDCGSTGLVTLNFSNNVVGPTTAQRLPPAFYYAIAFENTTITIYGLSYTNQKDWGQKNGNGATAYLYDVFTLGTPTPATAALPTLVLADLNFSFENYPIAGFAP